MERRLASEWRLAAKNTVVPNEHLESAGATVESVVVWPGDNQELVVDPTLVECAVKLRERGGERIAVARDEAKPQWAV